VPRTLSGKKMELPVKKLLLGQPLEKVAHADAMAKTLARFAAKLEKLNAAKRPKPLKVVLATALAKKRAGQSGAGSQAAPSPATAAGKSSPAKRQSSAASLRRVKQMAGVRARNARNQAKRDSRG
jgi:hypothetical protein